jgi:DnaJ-class molecular chaperone
MPQCPDCDSVKMFCEPPEGNGMCSACQGTGFAEFCDAIALELLNVERPLCEECNGSGQCQTCSGMGVIEEENIKIAA